MKLLAILRNVLLGLWAFILTVAICADATYRYVMWESRIPGSEAEARCNAVKPGSKPERTAYGLVCWRKVPVFYFADEVKP